MESMRSKKPIRAPFRLSEVSAPFRLSEVSPNVAFETVPVFLVCLIDDGSVLSFRGRSSSASSFQASLLQAIDGRMSLAVCPQVMSQAPQHFKSPEKMSEKSALCNQTVEDEVSARCA